MVETLTKQNYSYNEEELSEGEQQTTLEEKKVKGNKN